MMASLNLVGNTHIGPCLELFDVRNDKLRKLLRRKLCKRARGTGAVISGRTT